MDLGMFNRVCPSLKIRVLIDERRFDMTISDKKLYLCIERMFGLTNGCRILEIIYYRLAPMILAHSRGEVGDHLK
jgi:hypothetical protein